MNLHLPVPATNVAFTVFGVDIMWYGILICAGMILGVILAQIRAPKYHFNPDKVIDVCLWMIPFGIIGARAYYVIFQWEDYQGDIKAILNIRNGGLAIHGAIIAGILVLIALSLAWKIRLTTFLDLFSPSLVLAQAIGRWGNYFNQEAHGGPTDLPWGILVDGEYVHPTFLYESIWCFLLFFFLWFFVTRHQSFRGEVFLVYGILYSVERFFVEGLRTDSLYIGQLRQAQVLSAGVFVVFTILFLIGIIGERCKHSRNPYYKI